VFPQKLQSRHASQRATGGLHTRSSPGILRFISSIKHPDLLCNIDSMGLLPGGHLFPWNFSLFPSNVPLSYILDSRRETSHGRTRLIYCALRCTAELYSSPEMYLAGIFDGSRCPFGNSSCYLIWIIFCRSSKWRGGEGFSEHFDPGNAACLF
jgi:hypothetical protein